MPRNICLTSRVLDADPSPCVTCVRREECPVAILHGQLQRAEGAKPTNKRSIVASCSGYRRAGGSGHGLDIRESLTSAGAADLCHGCGERATGECEERIGLDKLRAMADAAYGLRVEFSTFCCCTKAGPFLLPTVPA